MLSHVRSVTIFGQPVKTSLLPSSALRLLDLGDCWDIEDHHLASIETLFRLKYLRLSSPSITKVLFISKNFLQYPSHRIFERMHEALNAVGKNN